MAWWPRTRAPADLGAERMRVVGRHYHFNFGGVMYAFITLLLMVGAINAQNNLLFGAFGLALAGLVMSGVLSGAALMGIDVRRCMVEPAMVGRPARVRYVVHNRATFTPAFGLAIEELPAGHLPWWRRWLGMTAQPAPDWTGCFAPIHTFVAAVGPRKWMTVETSTTALRRGEAVFDRVRVKSSFPFGLMGKSVTFAREQRAVVRPAVGDVAPSVFRRLTGSAVGALSAASRAGPGIDEEFMGVREYAPGDPLRQIAWRVSARTLAAGGTLTVRRTSAASSSKLWVVVVLSPAAEDADANELAISAAASIVVAAGRPARGGLRYSVGLVVPGAGLLALPKPKALNADFILDDLARIDLSKVGDADASIPSRIGLGQDSVVVLHAGGGSATTSKAVHISAGELPRVFAQAPPATSIAAPGPGGDS